MDVGVDVGGTFTDFVGFWGRAVVSAKLPSSKDPAEAVSRDAGTRRRQHVPCDDRRHERLPS
jgi:N-methylhydantoinase A/oxoprolinase/acetone carboxylase beta subunit